MKLNFLTAISLCCSAFAAAPVGTVSASGSFELGGTAVRAEGVPSWPLVAGTAVKAHAVPVVIRMKDGTRVMLRAQSQVIVEERAGGLALRLLSGAMSVAPAANSTLTYYRNSELVPASKSSNPTSAFEVKIPLVASQAAKAALDADAMNLAARRPPPPPVSSR